MSTTKDDAFVLGMFTLPALMLLFIPLALYRAWALRLLWGWFVVTTFGLPPLTYPQAIGVMLVVCFFQGTSHIKKEYKDPFWEQAIASLLNPIIGVGFGWVVRWWFQ